MSDQASAAGGVLWDNFGPNQVSLQAVDPDVLMGW
jgi:hypothetical protein